MPARARSSAPASGAVEPSTDAGYLDYPVLDEVAA
jgi:hypothetical protein